MNQENTPLFDGLKQFIAKQPISYHVPGHKNGLLYEHIGEGIFNALLQMDATEVEGLDDLHEAEGIIEEAQQLLSKAYNSAKSYFLVNGSTVGNLAMILGVCREGDTVLVQRNCHKSIMNALALVKAKPIFLKPYLNEKWGIAEGVPYNTIQKAIKQHPDAKAVILTYPTYYGTGEDITEHIALAHEKGIQVLVDEAHGAHFIAGAPFPRSSLTMGADYVVHSAHKTLPAMTMGSYLHMGKYSRERERVHHYLQMLQSSSPSYPIMASLDLARSYIATYSKKDAQYIAEMSAIFKRNLNQIECIAVLENTSGINDCLKMAIMTDGTFTGLALQEELATLGVYTELADVHKVLFILPLLKKGQHYPFEQTVQIVSKAVEQLKEKENKLADEAFGLGDYSAEIVSLSIGFSDMESCTKEMVPLAAAAGRIAAETITPYPPGIPLLLNGETISEGHVGKIQSLIKAKARFHGFMDPEKKRIRVYGKM
ncbi:aminotransferase class I/II-fold pyridoxal phosphate-dependent enzyme [Bacillus sp. 1P06AnD]|uniref:aminotransferase class I/II-fold pyridoxal phosphate-dependent enzyme n=1 Tax=Bacillus sp. 1P06AnD TaxID=3132208 RepID=UPI00399F7A53